MRGAWLVYRMDLWKITYHICYLFQFMQGQINIVFYKYLDIYENSYGLYNLSVFIGTRIWWWYKWYGYNFVHNFSYITCQPACLPISEHVKVNMCIYKAFNVTYTVSAYSCTYQSRNVFSKCAHFLRLYMDHGSCKRYNLCLFKRLIESSTHFLY